MPASYKQYFGQQFDERRTKEAHGDKDILLENFVNLNVAAGLTHLEDLMEIGRLSVNPFPIKYLNPQLREPQFPRGRTYFGDSLAHIRRILLNYPGLRWWMESDGLVVDEVPPELDSLSRFDQIAGPLMTEHCKGGTLSASSLALMATRLDAEGFRLKENLQPAQWKPISTYNQKHSRAAIETFSAAAGRPLFARSVRRRLYVARDRYKKVLSRLNPYL